MNTVHLIALVRRNSGRLYQTIGNASIHWNPIVIVIDSSGLLSVGCRNISSFRVPSDDVIRSFHVSQKILTRAFVRSSRNNTRTVPSSSDQADLVRSLSAALTSSHIATVDRNAFSRMFDVNGSKR